MARLFGLQGVVVTVPTAGTAVPVSSTQLTCTGVEFYVPSTNTGVIYIGGSNVDNTMRPIAKTGSWSPPDTALSGTSGMYDLSQIYVTSANNNDTVIVTYTTITQSM